MIGGHAEGVERVEERDLGEGVPVRRVGDRAAEDLSNITDGPEPLVAIPLAGVELAADAEGGDPRLLRAPREVDDPGPIRSVPVGDALRSDHAAPIVGSRLGEEENRHEVDIETEFLGLLDRLRDLPPRRGPRMGDPDHLGVDLLLVVLDDQLHRVRPGVRDLLQRGSVVERALLRVEAEREAVGGAPGVPEARFRRIGREGGGVPVGGLEAPSQHSRGEERPEEENGRQRDPPGVLRGGERHGGGSGRFVGTVLWFRLVHPLTSPSRVDRLPDPYGRRELTMDTPPGARQNRKQRSGVPPGESPQIGLCGSSRSGPILGPWTAHTRVWRVWRVSLVWEPVETASGSVPIVSSFPSGSTDGLANVSAPLRETAAVDESFPG